jgi:MacB-like periplasmic core domain
MSVEPWSVRAQFHPVRRLSFTRLLIVVAAVAFLNHCKDREYSPPVEVVTGVSADFATLSSGWQTINLPMSDGRPLAAFASVSARIGGEGPTEHQTQVALVTSNFFEVCGEQAALGRLFGTADRGALVAVLGYRIWSQRFGRNREIIGRGIRLNDQVFTVVAVAPQRFEFPKGSDVWVTAIHASDIPSPVIIRSTAQ